MHNNNISYYYVYTLLLFSFTRGERTVPDLCRSVFRYLFIYFFFFSIPHNVCGGRGNDRELAGDGQYTHNIRGRVSGVFLWDVKCRQNVILMLKCHANVGFWKNKNGVLF